MPLPVNRYEIQFILNPQDEPPTLKVNATVHQVKHSQAHELFWFGFDWAGKSPKITSHLPPYSSIAECSPMASDNVKT